MSPLRLIYLALTVTGALPPLGRAWSALAAGEMPGAAGAGFGWDMRIAALALAIWALAETWVRRNWTALAALPVTWAAGIGCGLPLYLFLRTRRVD